MERRDIRRLAIALIFAGVIGYAIYRSATLPETLPPSPVSQNVIDGFYSVSPGAIPDALDPETIEELYTVPEELPELQ